MLKFLLIWKKQQITGAEFFLKHYFDPGICWKVKQFKARECWNFYWFARSSKLCLLKILHNITSIQGHAEKLKNSRRENVEIFIKLKEAANYGCWKLWKILFWSRDMLKVKQFKSRECWNFSEFERGSKQCFLKSSEKNILIVTKF